MSPSGNAARRAGLDHASLSRLPVAEIEDLARELFAAEGWTGQSVADASGWVVLERGENRLTFQTRGEGRWHLTPAVIAAAEGAARASGSEAAWLVTAGTFAPTAWELARRARVRLADRNLLLQWLRDRLPERATAAGRSRTIACNSCGAEDQVRFTVDGHGPLFCSRCYRRQRRASRPRLPAGDGSALDWAA